MDYIKILTGLFFLSLFACTGDRKSENRIGTGEYTMAVVGNKVFALDSLTAQSSNYMQLLGDSILAVFNPPMNDIHLFDWATGKERGKIVLHKEGPNQAIGIRGFYILSEDSIWLYDEWKKELYLVNAAGDVKEKRALGKLLYPMAKQLYSVSPFPQTNVPISKAGDKLVLQGMNDVIGEGVLPAATILYDWHSGTISLRNPYPSAYPDKMKINEEWNTFAYREVPYTLNGRQEIVSSFPASDSIIVYDIKTDCYSSYFAGYSEETHIKPHVPTSKTDAQRNYLEQYQYSSILYDPYRELYYRLIVLPKTDYDLNNPVTQQKALAVIILDKAFKKVGEYQLENERYMYINSFVGPEGLCINIFSEDDDYLSFKVLNVLRNEK